MNHCALSLNSKIIYKFNNLFGKTEFLISKHFICLYISHIQLKVLGCLQHIMYSHIHFFKYIFFLTKISTEKSKTYSIQKHSKHIHSRPVFSLGKKKKAERK